MLLICCCRYSAQLCIRALVVHQAESDTPPPELPHMHIHASSHILREAMQRKAIKLKKVPMATTG